MNRRSFLARTAGVTAVVALAVGFASAAVGKDLPNIVMVMADDQGWGDMGYYGHPILKTPNFDKMAKETYRMDHFYAAHPNCTPTRASILTGRHPNRYGCFTPGLPMRPQEKTIAQELKRAGYATAHFGKWHVGSVFSDSHVNPTAFGFDEWGSSPNFYENDPYFSHNGVVKHHLGESSMVTVDATIEFMKKHHKSGKPFFVLVWFGSPHKPHVGSEELKAMYSDQGQADWLAEISGMDVAFGKMRDEISKMGIKDNTVLWYLSDNGGLFDGSCGGRGHKGSMYEGGLRVPSLFEWPARFPGHKVIGMPGNTLDIYPTIVDIVGLGVSHTRPMDGISLIPALTGKMKERPQPMGFWEYGTRGHRMKSSEVMKAVMESQKSGGEVQHGQYAGLIQLWENAGKNITKRPANMFAGKRGGHAAWLDYPWKLHRIRAKDGEDLYEFYNLVDDPDEQRSILDKHPDRVVSMKASLEEWRKSVVHSLSGEDYLRNPTNKGVRTH